MPACLSRGEEEFCHFQSQIFSRDRGSCNRLLREQYRSGAAAWGDWHDGTRNGALVFLAASMVTWFRGAMYVAAEMDFISFSRAGSECAGFSCFASSCNARPAYRELWPRCIQV